MNSEFAQRTRDISIFRAIGFQRLFLWTFFIIKSLIIGLIGSIIGFVIGNIALIILFNIGPRLMLIIDVLILVTISALIGCLSPLIKISKLNIPEMLNR
jgi:ABC-type antimicrobial peptide transport system permease subunit